jgi:hypothetical protein
VTTLILGTFDQISAKSGQNGHFCCRRSALLPVYFCMVKLVNLIGISQAPIWVDQIMPEKNIEGLEKCRFPAFAVLRPA